MLDRASLQTLLNDTEIYSPTGIRKVPSPQLLATGRALDKLKEGIREAYTPEGHLTDADRIVLFVMETCDARAKVVDEEIVRRMQEGPHSP